MIASEAAPFVKTGGLADVLGGLPPALKQLGVDVGVLLPRYRRAAVSKLHRVYDRLPVSIGGRQFPSSIDMTTHGDVPYYFLDCPSMFDRDGIYNDLGHDYWDNHVRYAVLCRAAFEVIRRVFRPQILHCHDWQAALLPIYLHRLPAADPTFIGIKTLFTIHNLGYQGRFNPWVLGDIGLDWSVMRPDLLEYYGDVNLLKGGIVYSDAISTVSRAYAREIQTPEYGFGLDGLLRARSSTLYGILNGVDYGDWNPETDRFLPAHYSADNLEGKKVCKRALLEAFNLPLENMDRPVLGIVSRFAAQKGLDIFGEICGALLDREDVCLVALGSGEWGFEELFNGLHRWLPDRVGVYIGYNNPLAHLIEAGSDMFLMPSRYEPCGLNQIYSLRYGTVPVVRATGGLDDTIDEGTGFKFHGYSGAAFLDAIRAALAAYRNIDDWQAMMRRGMLKDHSWTVSAREYIHLYESILSGKSFRAA